MEVYMNSMIFSILLIIIGLIVGIGVTILINYFRGNNASKKAEKLINQANKDAEKLKRESILENKDSLIVVELSRISFILFDR